MCYDFISYYIHLINYNFSKDINAKTLLKLNHNSFDSSKLYIH